LYLASSSYASASWKRCIRVAHVEIEEFPREAQDVELMLKGMIAIETLDLGISPIQEAGRP